jgi:hypothetical protein
VADVLEQVAAGAVRDGGGDLVAVVGGGQHDDLGVGVGADEAAGRLEAAEARHADVHEDEVGLLVREAREHLLAARSGLDPVDARDAGHELAQPLTDDAVVVADQHGGHRRTSGRTAWRGDSGQGSGQRQVQRGTVAGGEQGTADGTGAQRLAGGVVERAVEGEAQTGRACTGRGR